MNVKHFYVITILSILSTGALAQESENSRVEWNGYTQLRFTGNFDNINSFSVRMMKLWLNSTPGLNEHCGFNVQAAITSNQNEKFLVQDVMAFYKLGHFKINMGQFVPHYSLQRFQPDYGIPLTERSDAINALIPNGTLGDRDIGVEADYSTKDNRILSWFGAFNGYGIKEYRFDNSGVLLTQKTAFQLYKNHLYAGYSVMFRRADKLIISKVLPDSVFCKGNDFRFNLFAQWYIEKLNIQAEYLQANLNGKLANGWYLLACLNFGKNQLAASWNQYNDAIESTVNFPVLHLGYNYLAKGDKLKFMLDNEISVNDHTLKNYFITLQFQLFFN